MLELKVLFPFQFAGLPEAVTLCLVSLWQYMHAVIALSGFQYPVEFHIVPFEALSLCAKGEGILGGALESFESKPVVWWQVMQVTAVELLLLYVASGCRYFTGCTSLVVFR